METEGIAGDSRGFTHGQDARDARVTSGVSGGARRCGAVAAGLDEGADAEQDEDAADEEHQELHPEGDGAIDGLSAGELGEDLDDHDERAEEGEKADQHCAVHGVHPEVGFERENPEQGDGRAEIRGDERGLVRGAGADEAADSEQDEQDSK